MTFAPQPRPAAAAPLPMRVVSIPRLAQGGRWRVEAMRALSEPVLLWFTRGQGRITVAGLTRGYGGHNAVFIPAGTMHGFEAGPGVLGSAVFFGRTPAHPLPARPLHLRLRDAARQAEFTALLDSLRAETESSRPGRERAAALYLGLIGVWLERNAAQADAAPADAARRLAQRFTDLIEAEFRTGAGVA
ncbi:MAG: AraC family transcriptional regulator, partial [Rhodobacteraceae bacterium]|nr:AraC family transcriptional regulator [Paracoccaceae bacterium]